MRELGDVDLPAIDQPAAGAGLLLERGQHELIGEHVLGQIQALAVVRGESEVRVDVRQHVDRGLDEFLVLAQILATAHDLDQLTELGQLVPTFVAEQLLALDVGVLERLGRGVAQARGFVQVGLDVVRQHRGEAFGPADQPRGGHLAPAKRIARTVIEELLSGGEHAVAIMGRILADDLPVVFGDQRELAVGQIFGLVGRELDLGLLHLLRNAPELSVLLAREDRLRARILSQRLYEGHNSCIP